MKGRRLLLLVGLVFVVGAALALVRAVRPGAASRHGSGVSSDPAAEPVAVDRAARPSAAASRGGRGDAGGAPAVPESERVVRDNGMVEYTRPDGTKVADHRNQTGIEHAPRVMQTETTSVLYRDTRPLLRECTTAARERNRAFAGRAEAQLMVHVAGGTMSVQSATVVVDGIDDPEFVACATAVFQGREVAVPEGQADVDSYPVSLPIRVR